MWNISNFTIKHKEEPVIYSNNVIENKYLTNKPFRLNPLLKNGILYINKISAKLKYKPKKDKKYIKSMRLMAVSRDDVEVLIQPINAVIPEHFTSSNYIDILQEETPLFKLHDLDKKQNFLIIFRFLITDYSEQIYKQDLFCNFIYNNSVEKFDVNGDGKVDMLDVLDLADHLYQNKKLMYPSAIKDADIFELLELTDRILQDG